MRGVDTMTGSPMTDMDKGAPGDGRDIALAEIGAMGLNLLREDMPLPVAVIREQAMRRNSAWMRAFLAKTGAAIAPHGKTTMAPDIFALQNDDGAWGITVSTPHQIRVARAFGFKRLFVANQIVGRAAIDYVFSALREDADFELYCIVDSIENVAQLDAGGMRADTSRRLSVLVELGMPSGRTGCRTQDEAMAVARAVAAAPHLALAGIEGFEGIALGAPAEQRIAIVTTFLDQVVGLAEACSADGLFETDTVLLSAGGTAYFDLVTQALQGACLDGRDKTVLLRSGCYITHDAIMYEHLMRDLIDRAPDTTASLGVMEQALEIWAYVQSRPEPGRVIATIGKRDISSDDMPVVLRWYRPDGGQAEPVDIPAGHKVVALNDQHAYLNVPEDSPLAVGDMVCFGMSHPCLTFDKWRLLYLVDDAYGITGAIRTYF